MHRVNLIVFTAALSQTALHSATADSEAAGPKDRSQLFSRPAIDLRAEPMEKT
jgi:hypothetical protein